MLQSAGSAEANSVEMKSRCILLLVVLASFCSLFLALVLGRFVVFDLGQYFVCTVLCVVGFYSLPSSDLVSYRGPRSMVTVDMSVDSRSTDGRYFGRASVATRSTLGR